VRICPHGEKNERKKKRKTKETKKKKKKERKKKKEKKGCVALLTEHNTKLQVRADFATISRLCFSPEKAADSKAVTKTMVEMGEAADDLSVFEKIVSVSLPMPPKGPVIAPKRSAAPTTKPKPKPVRKTGPVPPVPAPTPTPVEPDTKPTASRPVPQPPAQLKVPPPPAADANDGGEPTEHGYTDEPLYAENTTGHYPEFAGAYGNFDIILGSLIAYFSALCHPTRAV